MRAGSTFSVDIEMKVAGLADTITVRAESPMIEVLEAKTSFAISGELLRAAPVTTRGLYSDAIDMVPGIQSRQGVDGSGVRVRTTSWAAPRTRATRRSKVHRSGVSRIPRPHGRA